LWCKFFQTRRGNPDAGDSNSRLQAGLDEHLADQDRRWIRVVEGASRRFRVIRRNRDGSRAAARRLEMTPSGKPVGPDSARHEDINARDRQLSS